jgi:hypothetical protein
VTAVIHVSKAPKKDRQPHSDLICVTEGWSWNNRQFEDYPTLPLRGQATHVTKSSYWIKPEATDHPQV